jgi:beta-phosphoglucomutase-like phosphatase (HAD superfamily)
MRYALEVAHRFDLVIFDCDGVLVEWRSRRRRSEHACDRVCGKYAITAID